MTDIAVTREGQGPELLLVHGGASPRTTWSALAPLARSHTLLIVHRHGYPPNAPAPHDFEQDARDLAPLLETRPHVLAHSYGGLGALIAAAANPAGVRSLSIIESPLFHVAADEPEVREMQAMSDAILTQGLDAEPVTIRAFLRLAGAPNVPDGPLPPKLARSIERARGARLPGEARPQLAALREAGVPSLVASGGHSPAVEQICDALAAELSAERLVLAGAGHFVQRDPRFAELLSRHLAAAERADRFTTRGSGSSIT